MRIICSFLQVLVHNKGSEVSQKSIQNQVHLVIIKINQSEYFSILNTNVPQLLSTVRLCSQCGASKQTV